MLLIYNMNNKNSFEFIMVGYIDIMKLVPDKTEHFIKEKNLD